MMAMLSRVPEGDKWFVDGSQSIECASPDDATRLEAILNEQSAELAGLRDALEAAHKPYFEAIENNDECLKVLEATRTELARITLERDKAWGDLNAVHAELTRLLALGHWEGCSFRGVHVSQCSVCKSHFGFERDSLAAENRLLLQALTESSINVLRDDDGRALGSYCACIGLVKDPIPHEDKCLVLPANRPPLTAREVERVEALEDIADLLRLYFDPETGLLGGSIAWWVEKARSALAALDKVCKEAKEVR